VGEREFADVARARRADAVEDCRGVAVCDLNGDGRLDLAINVNHENTPPVLLMNRVADSGNFMFLKLIGGSGGNRDAIGARASIEVDIDGKRKQITRWVEVGTGYAAQSEMRLHFGLADAQRIESLAIRWPDGTVQELAGDSLRDLINGAWVIRQGSDQIAALSGSVEIAMSRAE
jgi:hypothetical protein